MESDKIKARVAAYYAKKIESHGPSHWGVDWNSKESQELRFAQLTKVIPKEGVFSLIDYGCGYGALYPWLKELNSECSAYTGFDLSEEMISAAKEQYGSHKDLQWCTALDTQKADYLIASGIFNVKMQHTDAEWKEYILQTLHELRNRATDGFSFNILTSFSDAEYRKDYLYYADPLFFFDYCKRNFSRNVALLHDYGLYEFTILIRPTA